MKTTNFVLVVGFLFLLVSQTFAQNSNKGIVEGRILNAQSNQPVAFASIVIWGTNKGTLTNEEGVFRIEEVKPGYIEIQVSCIGFEPYTSEQILVTNSNKAFVEVFLKESSQLINEVVVKVSPFRREKESPLSLRRLGIMEINGNPGGNRDISKVIQSLPGVATTPSFRNDIIVRGGGSSENRYFLNGIEIPNINHFATQGASGGPVGIINVDLVKEVNFYSGAFPVDRGNALSSVIELNMIEGNNERFKVRTSLGSSDLGLTINGPLSKKTTFIGSYRHSYLQFLAAALELPFLPTYDDFQFHTRIRINKSNEINITGVGAIDRFQLNTSANKTEEQRYTLQQMPVNKQWNYSVGLTYKHYTAKGSDTWVLSSNMLNNKFYKYSNNIEILENKLLDYKSVETETKSRYEHSMYLENGRKLKYGAGVEYAIYHNSTFKKTLTGSTNYNSELGLVKWYLFAQTSQSYLSNKLTLSVGVRADACDYSSGLNNLLNQFSPRFSLTYNLLPNWHLNANAGRYFELPPYTSLGYRDATGVLVNRQNGLKYISADHYVMGIDYSPEINSKISVEGFYKQYNNYMFSVTDQVTLASKGTEFGVFGDEEIESTGTGRAYGSEFLYQNKDLEGFNLTLSYTLVWSEFKGVTGKYVPTAWDNRHLITLLGQKQFSKNWDVGLKWRYVGGGPYTPADLGKSSLVTAWDVQYRAYPDYTRYNTERLKSFHQLDVRVQKGYFFNKWTLMAYIDIQNIYNYRVDTPPTWVRATNPDGSYVAASGTPARYELKKLKSQNINGIVPTIGIIVEL